ncbi:MAG: PD40 domain-containing protein, partial [Planctomycetes bacterium]|nr:PD40 domain-containing protein [Planctomycetota bacterium]
MGRARTLLVMLAAFGLVAAVALWVGIKIGRPVYYSDGAAPVSATELTHASMLRFGQPERELSIPGPVRGRVATLPDGRLLYGLVRGPRTTELVVWDPRRPDSPPAAVPELNSGGHDLAPMVAGDRLWFASDRPSGAGGFDLYTATFRDGVFFAVRPLPQGINTGLDETDPAVDPFGGQLVFVRRDPEQARGRNGVLMMAPPGSVRDGETVAVTRVFAEPDRGAARRHTAPPIDRDPVFAPDGIGLYFVREVAGGGLSTMRTFWHGDAASGGFANPVPIHSLQHGGAFRSPQPIDHGRALRMVEVVERDAHAAPGSVQVGLYRAALTEVYPHWEGQWWLEWLLLSTAAGLAALLVLLVLGSRWRQLDLITKLLLLSLLIHLLLLLWMARVRLIRSFAPESPGQGAVEVQLIAQQERSGEGQGTLQQATHDNSRDLQFAGHEQALAAEQPEVAFAATERDLDGAELERPSYQSAPSRPDAAVADAAREWTLRDAAAEATRPRRREVVTTADPNSGARAERRAQAAETIRVAVPGSSAAPAARTARDLAPAPTTGQPVAQSMAVGPPELADRARATAARSERVAPPTTPRPGALAAAELAPA